MKDIAIDFLEGLTKISTTDIKTMASHRAHMALKEAFIKEGLTKTIAWKLVSKMTIEVNDAGVNHPQFINIVEKFAEMISKLENQLFIDMQNDKLSDKYFEEIFLNFASRAIFSLNL